MRKSKNDFVALIASGEYYAILKPHDRNLDDIALRREDGRPAEIYNYPYRVNQLPTYLFHEFLDEGILREDGADEQGCKIFRAVHRKREPSARAA